MLFTSTNGSNFCYFFYHNECTNVCGFRLFKNWIGTGTFFTPLMIKGTMTHEYITEGQNVCQQETSFQEYVYVRVRNSSTEHLIKKGSFQI